MATRTRKNSSALAAASHPIKESVGTVLSTFSGPSTTAMAQSDVAQLDTEPQQRLATQKIGAQAAGAAMPANPLKAGEHGLERGHAPQPGKPVEPHDPIDTAQHADRGRDVAPRSATASRRPATTRATTRSTACASIPAARR